MRLKMMNSNYEFGCRLVLGGLDVLGKEVASRDMNQGKYYGVSG